MESTPDAMPPLFTTPREIQQQIDQDESPSLSRLQAVAERVLSANAGIESSFEPFVGLLCALLKLPGESIPQSNPGSYMSRAWATELEPPRYWDAQRSKRSALKH